LETTASKIKILILGSGGREHALAWKISQSPLCEELFIAPGNPGTSLVGKNVDFHPSDFSSIGQFILEQGIELILVGPEEPLVMGIADYFAAREDLRHVMVVGPAKAAAQLEGSKAFAKAFMQRHGIPTAAYRAFVQGEIEDAKRFVASLKPPYVIKADGLAAGKGVAICQNVDEANLVLEEMLLKQKFGKASDTVVIEEFLHGIELSVFAITDGSNFLMLPEAKDYKRIGENDSGPNTGGMGAISPVPFADAKFMEKVLDRIVKPTVDGLKNENIPYCGFLFFGLMNDDGEPSVIEYNVRLGDPEAEAILPRIESDFVSLLIAAANGTLYKQSLKVSSDFAATIILASGGYPGNYSKGMVVSGIDKVKKSNVFYAGLTGDAARPQTSGGRVIALTSLAPTLPTAIETSYQSATCIDYDGKYFRGDIGRDLLKYI
jgi:phosphoribosylamine--glycine ligase